MAAIDASGLIPTNISATVQQESTQKSIALTLGRTMPMPAGISQLPVPASFPTAAWTATVGGRKHLTDFTFSQETLTAEELSAVIYIPDSYLEDSSVNLWAYARPLLAEALALALDDAVLFGTAAPPSFPVGGVVAASQLTAAGADVVDTVNKAMGAVEGQGLRVSGHAADVVVQGALRGVRDATGAFLLGPGQSTNPGLQALYGYPIMFSQFPNGGAAVDFITGDWSKLVIGVRQDLRYVMSSDFTIADGAGVVVATGFQDNMTAMKVFARYGCAILTPATRRVPGGAKPWAHANLVP